MDPTERAVAYVEIVELLARYAQIIDGRDWAALDQVFTPDASFDATSIGYAFLDGLERIRSHMAHDARHPAAHLVLNVTADISADADAAQANSRLLALMPDGRVFVGEYSDRLRRGQSGWRITHRVYRRLSEPPGELRGPRPAPRP